MLHDRDSEAPQFGLIADTRLHKHLRRVNRTKRYHHLEPRANAMSSSLIGNLHASDSFTLESKPGDQCVSENSQVRPVHVWEDIRTEHGLTFSVASAHVDDRSAAFTLHHPTVLILKGRNPNRPGSLEHGRSDRVGVRCGLDKHGPSCSAVLWVWDAVPVFDVTINFQDRLITPCWVSRFGCKEIPVALVAARPNHHIDARPTSQYLAHRQRNGAAVHVAVRLGLEVTIPLAPKVHGPLARFHDTWYVIVATSLEQQHADVRVFGQTARHY